MIATIIGMIIFAIIIGWSLTLIFAKQHKRGIERGLYAASPSRDVLLSIGRSSLLKFFIGGAVAVLAYWSGLDWGTYTSIAITVFDIVSGKIEDMDDDE